MKRASVLAWCLMCWGHCLAGVPGPQPTPLLPGIDYRLPDLATAPGAPRVYEFSLEAGPDESLLLLGEGFTTNLFLWGGGIDTPTGRAWPAQVQWATNHALIFTIPERAPDGVLVAAVKNAAGWSAPIVINAPQPWWCWPNRVLPGAEVRVFGRNLARRPDFGAAFVYLAQTNKGGLWAPGTRASKYEIGFRVPADLKPGDYDLWVHAGTGGGYGWGSPLRLTVLPEPREGSSGLSALFRKRSAARRDVKPGADRGELQRVLNQAGAEGGGEVNLAEGRYVFSGTLRIPENVSLNGAGKGATTLQLVADPGATFGRVRGSGWGNSPIAIHSPGDTMEYDLELPEGGDWVVWVRYATDMAPWNAPGVSGAHTLAVGQGTPVPLMNLENTGSWGDYRWTNSATLRFSAGRQKLTWKNLKGGGIALDAFLLTQDKAYRPPAPGFPLETSRLLVVQAEDCTRFASREGRLPTSDRVAVWLAGSGAALRNLTVLGNPEANMGVAIASPKTLQWLTNCVVENVRVMDCDGKQGENCGLFAYYVERAEIDGNELWGRAPLFIAGARQSRFSGNRLVPVTRFGGNAEAAIVGQNETVEECLIEENRFASPAGAEAGGPTSRRMLWFSTGRGSITRNWIARNAPENPGSAGQPRFGGVAGTDQNVGEMILFEGNHRTAFFGPIVGADAESVSLPRVVPRTPPGRLGNVQRAQLPRDAAGEETPFWPPAEDQPGEEPPLYEYYVTVFKGVGQGQTRRVVRREGERLWLDRPWKVPPGPGAVVAVATGFYQNLIVGNEVPDGMTGIQLWISCIENVIAGNTIKRQRKPGLFLFANATTLASSMPRTWNRGVSPLFWNYCEGNYTDECGGGVLITSQDENDIPVEFPRAVGNVIRRNSFLKSRSAAVSLGSRPAAPGLADTAPSIFGTLLEFNLVRDARTGFVAGNLSDVVLFRRNHVYFWYPVDASPEAATAFQLVDPKTTAVLELNTIEGQQGLRDHRVRELQTPLGVRTLQ